MNNPLVLRDHFQHAYVVRNLDKTMVSFKEKLGVHQWQVMPVPEGGPIKAIGLAYAQNVMIELIEAVPEYDSIYRDWIPESESAARFHHLGYIIDDEADFHDLVGRFDAAGCGGAFAGSHGDILAFHYADSVGLLGHYCELVHLKTAGKDYFSGVPHN